MRRRLTRHSARRSSQGSLESVSNLCQGCCRRDTRPQGMRGVGTGGIREARNRSRSRRRRTAAVVGSSCSPVRSRVLGASVVGVVDALAGNRGRRQQRPELLFRRAVGPPDPALPREPRCPCEEGESDGCRGGRPRGSAQPASNDPGHCAHERGEGGFECSARPRMDLHPDSLGQHETECLRLTEVRRRR